MTYEKTVKNDFSFDPVVETRLQMNGVPVAELSGHKRTLRSMAYQNDGTHPPSGEILEYLANILENTLPANEDAHRRHATVNSCNERYKRGMPISNEALDKEKAQILDKVQSLKATLPREIINAQGEINLDCLEKVLPQGIKRDWPRSHTGQLQVDTQTLTALGNDWADMMLNIKAARRAAILFHLKVDSDGRHRAWPNPFGTTTGRENPKGWPFVYLPKCHRSIIQPQSGSVVAQLDYRQQELTILAVKAGNSNLLDVCAGGDLYEHLRQRGPWRELSRSQVKRMTIALLYGGNEQLLAHQFGLPPTTASNWFKSFRALFESEFKWLDQYAYQAYRDRRVSSLDRGMSVTSQTPIRSIKNWPIQAAGADILRRACLRMDDAQIAVVGCIHDAILIEVDEANHADLINHAQRLMAEASSEVLDGVCLQTSIEIFKSDSTEVSS